MKSRFFQSRMPWGSIAAGFLLLASVAQAQLVISPSTLPDGTVGFVYGAVLSVDSGSGFDTWSISAGALPPGIDFAIPGPTPANALFGIPTTQGTYTFTVKVVDSGEGSAGTATQSYTIRIAGGAAVSVAPASLAFTGVAGGDATSPQTLTVGGGAAFFVGLDNGSGGPAPSWISASPGGGTAPALVTVTATPGTLAAGTYTARVRITPVPATTPVDVPVTFTLTAGTPKLETAPSFLRFSARVSAPGIQEQQIVVRNSGGGAPIAFQASAGGTPFLSVTPTSGQSTPNTPVIVKVRVNTAGLSAGNYTDTVRITSQAGNSDVAVSLFVADDGPILRLSESGLHFEERQGAGNNNTESVLVLNVGDPAARINWTAAVTASPNWISVTPAAGIATTAVPGEITVGLNASAKQLAPGAYYALVTVTAPNTQDSPQTFSAVLEVQPSTTPAEPELDPAGLLFVAPATGPVPATQKITIFDSSATPVSFQASVSTKDGGKWLTVSPATGTSSTDVPGVLNVSVNPAGLKAGVFSGEVDVNLSGVVRSAAITLLVPSGCNRGTQRCGLHGHANRDYTSGITGQFFATLGLARDAGRPPDGRLRNAVAERNRIGRGAFR